MTDNFKQRKTVHSQGEHVPGIVTSGNRGEERQEEMRRPGDGCEVAKRVSAQLQLPLQEVGDDG